MTERRWLSTLIPMAYADIDLTADSVSLVDLLRSIVSKAGMRTTPCST